MTSKGIFNLNPKWTASQTSPNAVSLSRSRVVIQCTYPVAGLHRLFSRYRFESEDAGVGSIVHLNRSAEGKWFGNENAPL